MRILQSQGYGTPEAQQVMLGANRLPGGISFSRSSVQDGSTLEIVADPEPSRPVSFTVRVCPTFSRL